MEVTDLEIFLKQPEHQQFLRVIPESYQPDLSSLYEYIKKTGHLLPGVNLTPATVKFSYTLTKGGNGNGKAAAEQRPPEVGTATE